MLFLMFLFHFFSWGGDSASRNDALMHFFSQGTYTGILEVLLGFPSSPDSTSIVLSRKSIAKALRKSRLGYTTPNILKVTWRKICRNFQHGNIPEKVAIRTELGCQCSIWRNWHMYSIIVVLRLTYLSKMKPKSMLVCELLRVLRPTALYENLFCSLLPITHQV